jgi:hypothetical protein
VTAFGKQPLRAVAKIVYKIMMPSFMVMPNIEYAECIKTSLITSMFIVRALFVKYQLSQLW